MMNAKFSSCFNFHEKIGAWLGCQRGTPHARVGRSHWSCWRSDRVQEWSYLQSTLRIEKLGECRKKKKNTLSSHEPLYMLIHIYFLWQTEDGLLCRLMSLTHTETRSLLCKYFQKVIDLREGSKKMEQQFAELEVRRLIYYISSLFP